jgi:hypothetical protein
MFRAKRLWGCCRISLFIGLTAMVCSCSDDGPSRPQADADPTYENIWPAAVGNYWEYDAVSKSYDQGLPMYDRMEDVPPIPPMEELYADLLAQSPGNIIYSGRGVYRLEFASDGTAAPDSIVLFLDAEMDSVENYASPPLPLYSPWHSGTPWTRTDDRMASYNEFGQDWLFFEGALTPGNEFEAPLSETIFDHLLLKTRIWRIGSFELRDTTYPKAIECFYVLDAGYLSGTDENGDPTGISPFYSYGLIVYVPEVGLVFCKEKFFSGPENLFERAVEILDYGRSD